MKRLFFFGVIILFLLIVLIGIFFPKDYTSNKEISFLVLSGEGTRDIAIHLEKEGLIWSAPLFRLFVLTTGVADHLQAGMYNFSPSISAFNISKKLATGEILKKEITIIEGWNLRDIGFYLENEGMFKAEELWEITGVPAINYKITTDILSPIDFSEKFTFLKDKPFFVGLEGYLFPDTYQIQVGDSIENIIRKMLKNFEKKISGFKNEITRQKRTLFEVLTIASLLEKEVQTQKDKALVAGILQNRLNIGMALQVDATVSYLIGKKDTKITKAETEIDSPFNTYKYAGLPLGPIANPGIESIEAALFPQKNQYFYYLSTPEGKTIFSKTLEEHNVAKALYLK